MTTQPPTAQAEGAAAQQRVGPFLIFAVASLLVGLWAGLARIGWDLPDADGALMLRHGGLMVVGFVATVIAVERAVALRSLPAFAAPALSAATGLALVAGASGKVAPGLAIAAGAAYSLNIAALLAQHRQPPLAVMLAAAISLTVAAMVWWDAGGFRRVVPWWMAFLALTIASERLEIIRFQRFSRPDALTGVALLALMLAGPIVTLADVEVGARVLGVALMLGPLWLVRRDIARRNIRTDGLARFAAAGVLTAYAWLPVAGVMLLAWGLEPGLHYDATIHAFFIGFVFTAIIAHEPIIAPAVTGLTFTYTPALYLPLLLLDGALVTRIAADLGQWQELRRWSGMVQVVAILIFLALTVASLAIGRLGAGRPGARTRPGGRGRSRGTPERPGAAEG